MNKFEGVTELIVRLVIRREGKILFCKNNVTSGYYLPGGHVEFGDTLEKTIYKETAEELGWTEEDIKNISFKGYLENSYMNKEGTETHHELNMIFDVQIGESVQAESQESHIDFEWVEVSNIPNIKILPATISKFIQ